MIPFSERTEPSAVPPGLGPPGRAAHPGQGVFARVLAFTAVLLLGSAPAVADTLLQVYAIRGVAGVVFSRGMNQLCDDLARFPQVVCTVEDFYNEPDVAEKAFAAVIAGQRPVFVGHSMGAHSALRIAAAMRANVPLIVTVDPNWFPTPPLVPQNAEVVLNYYQDVDVLGRATLQPAPTFRGELHQFRRNESHVMIDRSPEIRTEILLRVRNLLASQNFPQRKPAFPRSEPDRRKR